MDLAKLRRSVPFREKLIELDPEISIVGGALRDFLLNLSFNDFDVLVKESAIPFAEKLKEISKGRLVVLSEKDDEARVILGKNIWIDVAGRHGEMLEENLLRRDFTINAMAVPLKGKARLIDPLKGLEDLKRRIIRTPSKDNLKSDPLRILRALRFVATLGFTLDSETFRWMRELAFLLRRSARERIKYELFLILESQRVSETLWKMKELGVLEVIFPEITGLEITSQRYYEEQNLLYHSLLTVEKMEKILKELPSSALAEYREYIEAFLKEKSSKAILFLATLLHDIGKPATLAVNDEGRTRFFDHDVVGERMARMVSERLRLSKRESQIFTHLVRWHMYPHFLAKENQLTPRALNRFLRRNGSLSFPLIIMAIADAEASPPLEEDAVGYLSLLQGLKDLLEQLEKEPRKRLITGDDLISLGLIPGPIFSKVLQEIDDLQVEGKIKTREEALKEAKRIVSEIVLQNRNSGRQK